MKATDKMHWLTLLSTDERLSGINMRVAIRLINHLNPTTGQCNPSIERIARDIHSSKKTVDRAIKALKETGWVKVRSAQHKGRKTTNSYSFEYPLNRDNCDPNPEINRDICDTEIGTSMAGNRDTDDSQKQSKETEKETISSSRRKTSFSDEDIATADFIFQRIREINPNHKKPNLESWANTIRLIREQDNRTHEDICSLFTWANNDPFWKSNILCPASLRKQWDKLTIKRNGGSNESRPRVSTAESFHETLKEFAQGG